MRADSADESEMTALGARGGLAVRDNRTNDRLRYPPTIPDLFSPLPFPGLYSLLVPPCRPQRRGTPPSSVSECESVGGVRLSSV